MSNEHAEARRAAAAQMGCLKFWPAKRALSPSSSSILEEREEPLLDWILQVLLYEHSVRLVQLRLIYLIWTHLSSWLYLAKRSDRQGAPVLIWERN